jgi:capsid protein
LRHGVTSTRGDNGWRRIGPKPVYELWLEEAINKGIVDAPDFYERRAAWTRCKWIGPGRGWVDPVKEAKAAQLRMQIGLSTLEDECASQGLDWEEVLEQLAREKGQDRGARAVDQ